MEPHEIQVYNFIAETNDRITKIKKENKTIGQRQTTVQF